MQETKFIDLDETMDKTGLHEIDNNEDSFTWSNKHIEGIIYFKIDRALGNMDWMH